MDHSIGEKYAFYSMNNQFASNWMWSVKKERVSSVSILGAHREHSKPGGKASKKNVAGTIAQIDMIVTPKAKSTD